MPWFRTDDGAWAHPKFLAVGNAAAGAWWRMSGYASHQRTDGWIPETIARQIVDGRRDLDKLCTVSVPGCRGPLLHSPGDRCSCLEDIRWPEGAGGYWIHDFLTVNPSREENDVAKAQRKELRDRELRAEVRRRDGDRCRYCGIEVSWADRRSQRGAVLDHVDPRRAAGAENLVVSCRGCNSRKQKRTPEAAGMTLLPLPGHRRSPARIYDGSATDSPQTSDGSATDSENGARSVLELTTDPPQEPPDSASPPNPAPSSGNAAQPRSETALEPICGADPEPTRRATTDGPGRVGSGTGSGSRTGGPGLPSRSRPAIGPPSTPRTSTHPNPYLRHAIEGPAPEDHPGLPPGEEAHHARDP